MNKKYTHCVNVNDVSIGVDIQHLNVEYFDDNGYPGRTRETIMEFFVDDEFVGDGVATCRGKDNFCKDTGKKLAWKNMFRRTDIPDVIKSREVRDALGKEVFKFHEIRKLNAARKRELLRQAMQREHDRLAANRIQKQSMPQST